MLKIYSIYCNRISRNRAEIFIDGRSGNKIPYCEISDLTAFTHGSELKMKPAFTMAAKAFLTALFIVFSFGFADAQSAGAGTEWKTLNDEASRLYRLGDYDRAIVVARKALEIATQNAGPDHPDTALSLNNLAEFYRQPAAKLKSLL